MIEINCAVLYDNFVCIIITFSLYDVILYPKHPTDFRSTKNFGALVTHSCFTCIW